MPVLVLSLLDDPSAPVRWLGFAVAVAYGVPAILAVLLGAASLPFGVLVAAGVLPCGWTLPLAGPFLDISVEPTPPGTWSVTQLRTDTRGGGLSHTKAHDDAAVHCAVADFLLSRAATTSSPETENHS